MAFGKKTRTEITNELKDLTTHTHQLWCAWSKGDVKAFELEARHIERAIRESRDLLKDDLYSNALD